MSLETLFGTWNAVFAVPLAFVLLFLAVTSVLSLFGIVLGAVAGIADHGGLDHDLAGHSEVSGHADVGPHGDVSGHADLGGHGDVSADGDLDVAAEGHEVDPGLLPGALSFLGVGRAPVVMLVQVLLLLWGLIGLALNQALRVHGPGPWVVSMCLTLVLCVLGTRLFAQVFGRYIRMSESSAVTQSAIVGRRGKVVFAVSADAGTVHVCDAHGTLHRVRARSEQGPLPAGTEVVVVAFEPTQRLFRVAHPETYVNAE